MKLIRLNIKKRTLEKYMINDPDFKEFTTEILNSLGFIKNNNKSKIYYLRN